MAFDLGSGLNTISKSVSGAFSTVTGAFGTASKLAGALNNLSNPAALISSLRSLNLPKGGEAGVGMLGATASFGGNDASSDWRVRPSIPSSFSSSPVLAPLVQAGGLIFPYTPSITISSTASYEERTPVIMQRFRC